MEAYAGPMVGIDYSPASVALARTIAAERGLAHAARFEEADVVHDDLARAAWVPPAGFDVVLDKGTFDAISLSDETLPDGRRAVEAYPARVAAVVRRGGWLVVTSCNWTEEELRARLEGPASGLRWYGRVAYPSFRFGGREGSTICTVCFQKE